MFWTFSILLFSLLLFSYYGSRLWVLLKSQGPQCPCMEKRSHQMMWMKSASQAGIFGVSEPTCTCCPDTCVFFCESRGLKCGWEGESFPRLYVVIALHDLSQWLVFLGLPDVGGTFIQSGEEMNPPMSPSLATMGKITSFCFPGEKVSWSLLKCCISSPAIHKKFTCLFSKTFRVFLWLILVLAPRSMIVLMKEEQERMNPWLLVQSGSHSIIFLLIAKHAHNTFFYICGYILFLKWILLLELFFVL